LCVATVAAGLLVVPVALCPRVKSVGADGYHSTGATVIHPYNGCKVGAILGYQSINPRRVVAASSTSTTSQGGCSYAGAIVVANLFGGNYSTGYYCVVNYGAGGTYVTPALSGNPVYSLHGFGQVDCNPGAQVNWAPLPWHP
jgi:hypothetical protein